MKVIIVGAGKVGFSIAETLSGKDIEVVVIDTNPERLAIIQEYLDVQVLVGNGAAMSMLEKAGIANSDLLIAVTELDEINMMTCFVGKSYGVKSTIARVRKHEYSELVASKRQSQLGIDLIVNPELLAAQELSKLVLHPEAHEVEYFADGRVVMLGLKLEDNSVILNRQLKEVHFPRPCVVVGIIRGDQLIIPNGATWILPRDEVFLLAATKDMLELEIYLGVRKRAINNIAVFGGELLSFYLCELFETKHRGVNVKLFEENEERCHVLNEALSRTVVINGSGRDMDLMQDENIADMDVVLAVNDDDETNVMISMIAKHVGARKVISQIRRSDYVNMIESFGIDKAVSPRSLMVATILRFISGSSVLNLKLLQNDMAQMNEFILSSKSRVANKALKQLHFPDQTIVGLVVRSGDIIIPNGEVKLLPQDKVLTFASAASAQAVMDYLA